MDLSTTQKAFSKQFEVTEDWEVERAHLQKILLSSIFILGTSQYEIGKTEVEDLL